MVRCDERRIVFLPLLLLMAAWVDYINAGAEYATKAVAADKSEDYEQALQLYQQACDRLLLAVKWMPETVCLLKDQTRLKIQEYLSRAEIVKRIVKAEGNVNLAGSGSARLSVPAASVANTTASLDAAAASASAHQKAIRECFVPAGQLNVRWADVAGHEDCKIRLKQAVIMPIRQPQVCAPGMSVKGVLLYGPPGTGKTELAKALATESGCNFVNVSVSLLSNKYHGESEKIVAALFEEAGKNSPCIIFIDEIDSVLKARADGGGTIDHGDGAKAEFLIRWDGLIKSRGSVIVMGATNLPWLIDSAARRRFSHRVYIPLPDEESRKRIFEIHLRGQPFLPTEEHYADLAKRTDGYSGSDIKTVVQSALSKSLEFSLRATHFCKYHNDADGNDYYGPVLPQEEGAIKMTFDEVPHGRLASVQPIYDDFVQAISQTPKSVAKEDLQRYVEWTALYGVQG